jgi:hypothetical protein
MLAREGSEALAPLLAPSVEFDSAALYRPFVGKEAVLRLLPVLRDNGLQLVRFRPDGLITMVTGMVRPLSGLLALTEAMAPRVVTLPDGSHDIAQAPETSSAPGR